MNRTWIGVALLLVLLLIGTALTVSFDRLHRPLAEKLDAAADAATEDDWETALRLTQEAQKHWETHRNFTAAAADHEPLEEMEGWFAQLEILARLREADEFAAGCVHLSKLAEAMADSQQITWWSLL